MIKAYRTGSCFIIGVTAAVLFGCSQPNPSTTAGRSAIAGQQCAVCMKTNPGDYQACHAICVQRVDDEAAYLKAIGR
jgi:allophanate hydrolase subunit 1